MSPRTALAVSCCSQQGGASRGGDHGPLCGRLRSPVPANLMFALSRGTTALGAFVSPGAGQVNQDDGELENLTTVVDDDILFLLP